MTDDAPPAGLLDGIVVLDLTRVLAGPICGRALADLGARVIKVEPPAGDLSRFSVPRHGPISGYYAQQNAGKENVSVDLDHADGRALLFDLARRADVVLENFRPGVCERWGVGYDAVAAENPGSVYASLTGFGQTGPWARRRAYAVIGHAVAGTTAGQLQHQEVVAGQAVMANDAYSHGDVYTGLVALSGVLAALYARQSSKDFRDFAATIPDGEALVALLDEVGLAAGVVRSVAELAGEDHIVQRGSIVEVDGRAGSSFAIPQAPWRFSDATASVAGPPAWRGEHNRSVLTGLLGRSDDEVDALEAAGVLVARPPRG